MPDLERVPLLIIGGGPAGYTAALYAARAGLQPLCVESFESGGQITRSDHIENYPGAPAGTSGMALADRIREQATDFGARVALDDVTSVDFSRRPFEVVTTSARYVADAVIVATGSRPRALGLPREEELLGNGVAYCALCDGAFFAGLDVVVVGGGNAALGESIALARVASSVTVVHRRDSFRADSVVEAAARATPGVELLTPRVVESLETDDQGRLRAVLVRHVTNGELSRLETSGLFIAIGHQPATDLFAPFLELADGLVVTTPGSTATSVEGVFAAGDVADSTYRQAITAASSGCMAAIDAERWLVATQGQRENRLLPHALPAPMRVSA